jgi:DNA-binding beta-propeller fold protein YncE
MKIIKLAVIAFVSSLIFVSCSKDEIQVPVYVPLGTYDSGVLVLNEGNFGSSDASISYISYDLNTLQNNIFGLVNPSLTLGDVAQSIGFNGNLAYVVLNNSNKIQIINRYSMANVGSITTGLINPRYIAFANGKGYVTCWGNSSIATDDYIAVLNLGTNTISSTISVVADPERIIENGGKLYVAHYGFGNNNKISVIDSNSNTVVGTPISVGDGPNFMVINNGSLWVMCEGKYGNPTSAPVILEVGGCLQKINLNTNIVENTYQFATTNHPSNLQIYGSNIYYTINSSIYKMSLTPIAPATSIALPINPVFNSTLANIYGFAVKANRIYISGYSTFSNNGTVNIHSLGATTESPAIGTVLKSHTVGIGPNGFYFNM